MSSEITRRTFVGTAVASGVFSIVPRHVLGGSGFVAPSDKITLAHIGMGTQGFREIGGLLADPQIQIVAVCDPNTDSNDYVEWGKDGIRNQIRGYLGNPSWRESDGGCPGGREVGREVVDTYYAKQRGAEKFKACAAYADFRELLEKEQDLDAVKVMTPDHLHAAVSIAAMKKGKHVVMHKPIANRLHEGRLVLETARQAKVATHLLAYGRRTGNGLIAERIKQGVIGPLREIHNWTNRPVWPQYTEIPTDKPPVPKGLDWDLWLGPALDRPYHPHYTHTVFRGWYDFGGGSMADMGIYSLWPVFTALDLGVPVSAEAWKTHTCTIEDGVSRTVDERFRLPHRLRDPSQVRRAGRPARPGPVLVRRRHETASARGSRSAERGHGPGGHPVCRRRGRDHGRLPRAGPAVVRPRQEGAAVERRPAGGDGRSGTRQTSQLVDRGRTRRRAVGRKFPERRADYRRRQPGNRRLAGGQESRVRQREHADHQRAGREQVPRLANTGRAGNCERRLSQPRCPIHRRDRILNTEQGIRKSEGADIGAFCLPYSVFAILHSLRPS